MGNQINSISWDVYLWSMELGEFCLYGNMGVLLPTIDHLWWEETSVRPRKDLVFQIGIFLILQHVCIM